MSSYVVVATKLGVTVRDDLFGTDLKSCADNRMNGIVVTCINGSIHVELYDASRAQRYELVCPGIEAWDNKKGLDTF